MPWLAYQDRARGGSIKRFGDASHLELGPLALHVVRDLKGGASKESKKAGTCSVQKVSRRGATPSWHRSVAGFVHENNGVCWASMTETALQVTPSLPPCRYIPDVPCPNRTAAVALSGS